MRQGTTTDLLLVVLALIAGLTSFGSGQARARGGSGQFSWLHPDAPEAGWKVARIANGSTLAYPPAWRPIKTDPGTASVALLGHRDHINGYLNATPRQGSETLANWSRFRPQHNRREGSRSVRRVGSTANLRFRSGHGSCVIDDYTTSKATYREIACLAAGTTASSVVVAAAPIQLWDHEAPTLQRAVSSFVP